MMKNFSFFGKKSYFILLGSILFFGLATLFSPHLLCYYLFLGISVFLLMIDLGRKFSFYKFPEYLAILLLTCFLFVSNSYFLAYLFLIFYELEQILLEDFSFTFFQDIDHYFHFWKEKVLKKMDQKTKEIAVTKIVCGDHLLISHGDQIPVDGVVYEGTGMVDSARFVGRRPMRCVVTGDLLKAGEIYRGKTLEMIASTSFKSTHYQRFYQKLRADKKISGYSKWGAFFSSCYTVVMIFLFALTFFLSYFLFGRVDTMLGKWAFFFLAISPTSHVRCLLCLIEQISLWTFARNGICVSHPEKYSLFANLKNIVFAKTGILTLGKFRVTGVIGENEEKVLRYVRLAEENSKHAIARTVQEVVSVSDVKIKSYQEYLGRGIAYVVGKENVLVGNYYFMKEQGVYVEKVLEMATILYVVVNREWIGAVLLSDTILSSVLDQIQELKEYGFTHLAVLSGDNEKIVGGVSREVGITEHYSNLLPEEKSFWLHYFMEMNDGATAYIGDEETDQRLLKEADVGIVLEPEIFEDLKSDVAFYDRDFSRVVDLSLISRKYTASIRNVLILLIGMKILALLVYCLFPMAYFIPFAFDVIATILSILQMFHIFQEKEEDKNDGY